MTSDLPPKALCTSEKDSWLNFSADKPFVAEMYSSIPSSISPDNIGLSAQYSLLLHLTRTPISLSKDMQIEGDLLESWATSSNFSNFRLTFKKGQLFSNGEPITASTFKTTLDWQIASNSSLHFDFSNIETIQLINDHELTIEMRSPAKDFIRQLAHPEFGSFYRLYKTVGYEDFTVSSGPYSVSESKPSEILLKKNTNFPSSISYPNWVLWKSSGAKAQKQDLEANKVDFAVPDQAFDIVSHLSVIKNKALKWIDPNMGYSFFISINPNVPKFKESENRLQLLKLLSAINLQLDHLAPMWEKTNQLYLPGAMGRPSEDEVISIWAYIKSRHMTLLPKSISFLVSSKFEFTEQIVGHLKAHGIEVTISKYETFDEYTKLTKNSQYDLLQANNDFSSTDLLENLLVSFRETRPLIHTADKKYRRLLKEAENSDSIEKKSKIIRDIGLELLADGLVFPIAFYKKLAYAKSNVSFENWSKLFPDMRIYKLEVDEIV